MIDLLNNQTAKNAVNFLLHLYRENAIAVANIIMAQAEGDIDTIIENLTDIKNVLDVNINELIKLKESC